jgi:hypothetical protein
MGTTTNRFSDSSEEATSEKFESKLPDGAKGLISNSGNYQIIASEANISIKAKTNELLMTTNSFKVGNTINNLTIDNENFSVQITRDQEVNSKFVLSPRLSELYTNAPLLVRSNHDIIVKSNGNIIFGGNSTEETPSNMFHVKTSKLVMDSGAGPTVIQGSAFNVKISSPIASNLGTTAASIEVLQGNMDYSVGVGNITVRALSPLHAIKLTNGFTTVGTQSFVEITGMYTKMGAELASGAGAYIQTNRTGDIKITAMTNIAMKSLMSTSITANTTMTLDALVSMKLNTIKADIIAQAMIKFESMMMDLKAVKMIDAGPKVVVPGPGPFCSLPACPITGVILQGSICTG